MKRIFFSLLACGMFASAFAQIELLKKNNAEVSDKWVITPLPTMKGVLGRLDINFPADVERNILIYQQADNKFLRSVSRNDKIYTIAPGQYRFTLSNVPVDNVPIQKGHETRLKAGFLNVVSDGDWHLYNDTKEKAYTSGNKPKKLPLPVGKYQIKLGGQFFPVIIKDGETVEDYSTVEIKEKGPVEVNKEVINEQQPEIIPASISEAMETDSWVITPGKNTIDSLGLLKINFLSDSISHKSGTMRISRNGDPDILLSADDFKTAEGVKKSNSSYPLSPGQYQLKLNNVPVKNVPIKKDHETRLKSGKLKINFINPDSPYGQPQGPQNFYQYGMEPTWWVRKDTSFNYVVQWGNPSNYYKLGEGSCNITLPAGTYHLGIFGAYMDSVIVINDGETVNLEFNICMARIISANNTIWFLDKYNSGLTWAKKPTSFSITVLPLPYGKYNLRYSTGTAYSNHFITLDKPSMSFTAQ